VSAEKKQTTQRQVVSSSLCDKHNNADIEQMLLLLAQNRCHCQRGTWSGYCYTNIDSDLCGEHKDEDNYYWHSATRYSKNHHRIKSDNDSSYFCPSYMGSSEAQQIYDVAVDNVGYHDCNWWTNFNHLVNGGIIQQWPKRECHNCNITPCVWPSWCCYFGVPVASGTELLSISGGRVSSWCIWEGSPSAIKQMNLSMKTQTTLIH